LLETVRSGNKEFHDNICYSEAVRAAISQMDDDGLVNAILQAGYPDILEAFGLVPSGAPTEPAAEPATV